MHALACKIHERPAFRVWQKAGLCAISSRDYLARSGQGDWNLIQMFM